jgi:hypothetical protein
MPETARMRLEIAVLTALWCTGCTFFQKPAAQAPAAQQAVAAANPSPVADAPAKFECSDGTISSSQDACLVAMARTRLPPSQTVERIPADPGKPH